MKNSVLWVLAGIIFIVFLILLVLLLGNPIKKRGVINDDTDIDTINYKQYRYTVKDYIKYYIGGSVIAFTLAQVFYNNVILGIVVAALYLIIISKWKSIIMNNLIEKRKEMLLFQFKDALQSIVAELGAGTSFTNIIKSGKIIENLTLLHQKDAYIVKEMQRMSQALNHNVPEEEVLRDFAQRADIEDITNFVDVFTICRKQGGDTNKVSKNTANIIIEKINICEEIQTVITQKKQEQKIMTILPLGMVLTLKIMAPDYMEPLYTSIGGRIAMTIAILIIVGAHFTSKKIMNIEV